MNIGKSGIDMLLLCEETRWYSGDQSQTLEAFFNLCDFAPAGSRRKDGNMIITGMEHFQSVCKKKLVDWYNKNDDIYHTQQRIDLNNVFVVWSCKALQNYKALLSTTVSGDGIYAEYTYNGDKQELYEDVYGKLTNTCHTEEWLKKG